MKREDIQSVLDTCAEAKANAKKMLYDLVRERGTIEFRGNYPYIPSVAFGVDADDAYINKLTYDSKGQVRAELEAFHIGKFTEVDIFDDPNVDYAHVLSLILDNDDDRAPEDRYYE